MTTTGTAMAAQGIDASVVNLHTIKPLDEQLVAELARSCGAVVSAENHLMIGGLGDAVSQTLQEQNLHVPMTRVGIADTFAEGGSTPYLFNKYGLDTEHIVAAAQKAVAAKSTSAS